MANVFKICASIKNYEWGKYGNKSMVATLHNAAFKDFIIEENKPYAELWLGTHESGPATIPHLNNLKLSEWLNENKQKLGNNIIKEFGSSGGLPFLFKVLSVNKALSIQAHPNKETALKLHKEFPQHYPDDNHKPELAIALTDFEALCGFRPISEIRSFLREIEALQRVIGSQITQTFFSSDDNYLPVVFNAIMTASVDKVNPSLLEIVNNFRQKKYNSDLSKSICDIFLKTYKQYPEDIGCLCFFFLNYVELKPGQSVFLAANEPHAYLFGDCIECMACSDNVVRAGLTPKYRDVQTLCDILSYQCKSKEDNIFQPTQDPNDHFAKTYAPPVKEFAIDSISLNSDIKTYNLKSIKSASILLIVKGSGLGKFETEEINLESGFSLFVSADFSVTIKPSSDMLMFRAYCKE